MASRDSSKQAPPLCANRCGFFANSGTDNMCSKCYKECKLKEQLEKAHNAPVSDPTTGVERVTQHVKASASSQATSSGTPRTSEAAPLPPPSPAKRCAKCNKKAGIVNFVCRCGNTYCSSHRHADQHECTFDYKAMARNALANKLPVIKSDKSAKF